MVWGGGVMRQGRVLWEEGALVLERILEDSPAARQCLGCSQLSGLPPAKWLWNQVVWGAKGRPFTPSLLQGHPHLLPQLPRLSSFAP